MDIGPQPKLALFLSLTLMNLVAVGICICGPSSNDARSSQDSRKGSLVVFKKRIESILSDQVEVDTELNDAATVKITVEEDNMESTPEVIDVAQPPTVENAEMKVDDDAASPPDEHEKTENNLNLITINENFDNNESSEEGSDTSLNDMCGHGAEMRYIPHDMGKSVTAVIAKSFQLIDTFNTKVVPAVENFNEQISKTARLERGMDSNVVGTINSSICPAVIRLSDSINRMHEKINRVTENINKTYEPKERSVSCQVSESLLGKSIGLKKSFFCPISPTSEARIMNLIGQVNLRMISRRKDRPGFKTLATQYWLNRRRTFGRKFRKTRSTDNLKDVKNTKGSITHEESAYIGSCYTSCHVNGQQLRNFQEMNSEEIVKEEDITKEPSVLGDNYNVVEEILSVKRNDSRELNVAKEEINRTIEFKQQSTLEEPDALASSSNFCESPSLPSQLPSYLSSSLDDFSVQRSASKGEEPSRHDFRSSADNMNHERSLNYEIRE
uniref:Uncharacterized protein n=1 Tax=Lygus hesperus TaxID=30085 RepID=A0A0K8SEP0_LYGHE